MQLRTSITILLFLFTTFCVAQKNSPLVGTWKMISGKTTIKDSTSNNDLTNVIVLKIVTPTHLSYFAQSVSDSSLLGTFLGRVQMDEKNYKEEIFCASEKGMIGFIGTFTYTVDGDKWHLVGGGGDMKFDEIWQRVK